METNEQEISGLWSVRGVHPWYGDSHTNWTLGYKGEVSCFSFSKCPPPGAGLQCSLLSYDLCVEDVCPWGSQISGQMLTPDMCLTFHLSFGNRFSLLLNPERTDSARLAGQ